MPRLDVKYLEWDSGLLGLRCGSIDAAGLDPVRSPAILAKRIRGLCEKGDLDFTVIRIPAHLVGLVDPLVGAGASLIDAELSFSYSGDTASPGRGPARSGRLKVEFRKRLKGDAFIPLAREMHFSRYFNDPHIPRHTAVRLWEKSIRNHCGGLKDQLAVAFYDGLPCGIVTLEYRDKKNVRLFLVGVLKRYRRRSIGRTMLKAIVDRYSGKRIIHVETQAGNLAAQALYQSAGFKLENVRYILHYWRTHGGR